MPILDHAGGAVATTITGAITSSSTTITLADATGWPSGGANGEFYATINRGLSSEERILVQSRSGNTLTLASAAKRGVDGTAAASHDAGSSIDHGLAAAEVDEVNAHAFDTTRDDHTQYHNTARHAAVAHTQAMLQADSVGAAQIQANAVGSSELADNAVDTAAIANLAVTAGKIANDTITATQIAPDAIGSSELANNAVDTAAIADNAVTTAKILDDNVTAAKVADGAIDAAAKIVDGVVTDAKFASTAWTSYTPTLTNVTLGTGVAFGVYRKIGRHVTVNAGFTLGVGGDVTGIIGIGLPAGLDAHFQNANMRWVFGCWCQESSGPARFAASGIVINGTPGEVSRFVNAATALGFGASSPFDWNNGDEMWIVGSYETAA